LERSVWQPDHKFGADFFMAAPVATSTALGPTAPPSAPSTTSPTVSGYTANWTNGDATAETEVWEKEGAGGTWTLVASVAAGTATYARTGRTNHTEYFWKARHRKNGVTTDYTVETSAKTLIAAPSMGTACLGFGGIVVVSVTQNAPGTTITLESPNGNVVKTWPNQGSGTVTWNLGTPAGAISGRAKCSDASWPTVDSTYAGFGPVDC
jgi:hypothetical protein